MNIMIVRRLMGGVLALAASLAMPAHAQHFDYYSTVASSSLGGELATYTFEFMPHQYAPVPDPIPAGRATVEFTFGAGFDIAGASFDQAASRQSTGDPPTLNGAFPGYAAVTRDVTTGSIRVERIATAVYGWDAGASATTFRFVITGVRNPSTAGNAPVRVRLNYLEPSGQESVAIESSSSFAITIPPGVLLGATPARPQVLAKELIIPANSPLTVSNTGPLNLRMPLSQNLSGSEVRYARVECDNGMRFLPGTAVSSGGAATTGAVNGVGTNAITFSITAGAAGAQAAGMLLVSGDRGILNTNAVNCAYSLYDFPSQAQAGGSAGRLVSVSGPYIEYRTSTHFSATALEAIADVDAAPAYSRFVAGAPTTPAVAALARLVYGLVSPAPLVASGAPVTLATLHATGAGGTRIVARGDFGTAANADGSYSGAALNRVFLSASNADCASVGVPATALSASQASFVVGATATDRMLCLAPRSGVAIPASNYTATLDSVSAQPTVYAVADIGPVEAGAIRRNGTELQAPLVQIPNSWVSRLVLTNTGSIARSYRIRVLSETGVTLGTANLEGTVPASGTRVIDLASVLTSASGGAVRGSLVVNVSGPTGQIQGLYQIVNPNTGSLSNHVMVRPGTN